MNNTVLTIWLVCLTALFVITQVGDIGRWGQVGAQLQMNAEATKAVAEAQSAMVKQQAAATELLTLLVNKQANDK